MVSFSEDEGDVGSSSPGAGICAKEKRLLRKAYSSILDEAVKDWWKIWANSHTAQRGIHGLLSEPLEEYLHQ